MIVILCNSFQDAQDAFSIFMDFLESCESSSIKNVYEYSYCVELDNGVRYIFIDYRFKSLALKFDSDVEYIEMDEFFENLEDYYDYLFSITMLEE